MFSVFVLVSAVRNSILNAPQSLNKSDMTIGLLRVDQRHHSAGRNDTERGHSRSMLFYFPPFDFQASWSHEDNIRSAIEIARLKLT